MMTVVRSLRAGRVGLHKRAREDWSSQLKRKHVENDDIDWETTKQIEIEINKKCAFFSLTLLCSQPSSRLDSCVLGFA